MLTKKMFKVTAMAAALTAVLCAGYITSAEAADMRNSQDIVKEMGVGWNLGNTLDSHGDWITLYTEGKSSDFETAWGNPVTTKAMIDKVKEAGFTTVRVPVTWGQHIGDAPDYTVNAEWMNRVQEVVDYAIDDGLYVIVNVHHDEDWCIPTYDAEDTAAPKLKSLWTQIANRFKDYDDHLVFETLNEPRLLNSPEEWSGGTAEGREVVNDYNQAALDSIRATGGNNEDRSVMVPTYGAAGMPATIDDMKVPEDDHVIVSLHAYIPYFFALAPDSDPNVVTTWGTDAERKELDDTFQYFYDSFVAKGTPVVIGEFASTDRNNTADRVEHAKAYVSGALSRGMACCWWDTMSGTEAVGMGLLDRRSLTWAMPEVKDALMDTYKSFKVKPISIESTLNSWETGFSINMTLKNDTDSDMNGWTLKIKKTDLPLTQCWNADMTEDGDYIILKSLDWNSNIPAGGSISIGGLGTGAGTTDFDYEVVK